MNPPWTILPYWDKLYYWLPFEAPMDKMDVAFGHNLFMCICDPFIGVVI